MTSNASTPEQAHPIAAPSQAVIWACPVGFGLLLSFNVMLSLMGSRLPVIETGYALLVAQRLIEAATYLAAALFAPRLFGLERRHPLVWGCAAACVAGCLVVGLSLIGALSQMALTTHMVFSLIKGVAPALFWLCWISLYARMDMRHVLLYYLLANVVSACLTLVLSLAPLTVSVVAVCALLPLASAWLLGRASKVVDRAPFAHGETVSGRYRFPTAPVVLMAVFSFINVFTRDVLPPADRVYATLGTLVCLAMLLVALKLGTGRFGVWSLYGVAFPLTLAGVFGLLLSGNGWGIAATLCTHAGEALFTVFIGVTLCTVSFRHGVSALMLFGFSQAAGTLANLGAALAAFGTPAWSRDAFVLVVAAMGMALCVCYVALTRGNPREVTWGVEERSFARTAPDAGDQLALRCSRMAYEHGLTRREEEVLALLAQDKTAAQIEEALCVTNATVKSHTHAVYQKLGVHSRSELVELVRG